ncbi:BREX protein BrxB domain-containing protein [Gaetbulibacter saemankumensis]|uniref:BREX protein BrxB domain-containing protein n=1 Tax=Gaetbulibacter saemankumensis TaxID=311208 RepID=UPI001B7F8CD5|nr:BREX protein BrxB domain-containing protein [Gaetbulibacter saemankumensis]
MLEPKTYDHGGDKTICYLTFDTEDIINVKRKLNQVWVELAKNKGLEVIILSLHEVLKNFFKEDEYRIEAGVDAVEYEDETIEVYHSLGENLKNQEVIENAILDAQKKVDPKNGVLFITDLEAIHPFTRFGPIEQKIYNKINVPIVVFYPGEITGTALKFLGFYPEDGNYRSKHF